MAGSAGGFSFHEMMCRVAYCETPMHRNLAVVILLCVFWLSCFVTSKIVG